MILSPCCNKESEKSYVVKEHSVVTSIKYKCKDCGKVFELYGKGQQTETSYKVGV